MIKHALFAATVYGLSATTVHAGPQYVDETGFAASGYDVVAFFDLDQAPVGQQPPEAVPGNSAITAEHNGATWAFSSEENRDKFVADPTQYVPSFDGHCAYGVAQGGKVPGNPNLWRIIDGTLYMNITPTVVGLWESDIPGNLSEASNNWATVESAPASSRSWKTIKDNDGTYSTTAPLSN